MASLVPQFTPAEEKGNSRVRADSLRSGRLTGRYQLTGSLLVLKDTSNSVSGYLSFSTSIANTPTSSSSGTGVYIDYTGVYGLAAGAKQFYLQASDGKAYAGAGAVVIDVDGIKLDADGNGYVRFMDGTTAVSEFVGNVSAAGGGYVSIAWSGLGDATYPNVQRTENTVNYGATHYVSVFTQALTGLAEYTVSIDGVQKLGLSSSLGVLNTISASNAGALAINSATPSLVFNDLTGSAKSLSIAVDANVATFAEVTGGTIFSLDLANLNLDIADGNDVVLGSTTGTKIGTATTQKLSFYNATPVVRQGAYTQTYSTADKTHASPTAATLTDSTGGTANQTVAAVSGTGDDTTVNNNFADIVDEVNKLIADVADVKQLANSIIDDLQAYGLFA